MPLFICCMYLLIQLARILGKPITWEEYLPSDECAKHMRAIGAIDSVALTEKYDGVSNGTLQDSIPHVYFLGDSTVQNKHDFTRYVGLSEFSRYDLPHEYTLENWRATLLEPSRKVNFEWADVIVWNQGLHKFHLLPARRGEGNINTIDEFAELLRSMTAALRQVLPTDKVIYYKLTNCISEEKYNGEYQKWSTHWMDDPAYTMHARYPMQFTSVGSSFLNYVEKRVMRELNVSILNTFTAGGVECTGDGRHYHPLAANFWAHLIARAREDVPRLRSTASTRRSR